MKRSFILSILIILLLKLVFLITVYHQAPDRFYFPDSLTYILPAEQLLTEHRFYRYGKPEIFRTPGYPLFIAFSMLFTNDFVFVLIFLQIILVLILSIYMYRKREFFGIGLLASIFLFLDPRIIVSEFSVLSEILYLFFISTGFFLIVEAISSKINKRLFLGFILMSLATYIRPVAIFLVPLFVLILILIKKIEFKKAVLLILIHIVLLSCWMVRNKLVSDQFIFSSVGGKNLYYYTAAAVQAKAENTSYQSVKSDFENKMKKYSGNRRLRIEKKEAIEILIKNPVKTFRVVFKGFLVNVLSPGSELFPQLMGLRKGGSGLVYKFNNMSFIEFFRYLFKNEKILLFAVFPGFLWNLFLLGMFFKNSFKYRKELIVILGISLYLYHVVLTAGPAATSRFTAPIVPVMIVIAFRNDKAENRE